jgi:hypothetical protein
MGSVPQSVPCTVSSLLSSGTSLAVHYTHRRSAQHWRFTTQTVGTNANDSFSSEACAEPRNMNRVSHFLTSCSEILYVIIVPKILQISTLSNNSLAILISSTRKQTRLFTIKLLGRRTKRDLSVGKQLPAANVQPSHSCSGALRYTSSVFVCSKFDSAFSSVL